MTQQYLAGELSLLLGRLHDAADGHAGARDIARLRGQAEAGPLAGLPTVVMRALALTDALCWDSLQRGETTAFARQATIGAEVYDFGECAGLLEEGYSA